MGRLLRREGLYSSHLTAWRKARRKGSLRELAAKKRGAKPAERNPLDAAPNQTWSWDITKLLGPTKWTYFYL